ncbi:protein snakeskin-like [Artemia franciscana]|uniref:MARVEL domain-containing protein n=1 Tax=Artemia franciscana TaxID=6661 RepID=A0AA88IJD5_ARTSF|nr:hypothetical protein QYM36_003084 [Artemia franciscana]
MADLRVFARAIGFLKLAEVIVAIICLVLTRQYDLHFGGDIISGSYIDRYLTGIITIGGFLMISLALLISYVWGEAGTYQRFLELIFNFAGMIMFIVTGALVLEYYNSSYVTGGYIGAGKVLGVLCLINGLLYLIDSVLAYRQGYNTI